MLFQQVRRFPIREKIFMRFMIVPGFSTPEWAKRGYVSDFVDRFCNGDRQMTWRTGNIFISALRA